uniref:3',5'-cyclic-GMP phosphodiesterase n=1 Tax=Callorhinchus milii TaxID=7868 RepID=A0A4W3J5N8_CALMI
FGPDLPGIEGLFTDRLIICLWHSFGQVELDSLSPFGIL